MLQSVLRFMVEMDKTGNEALLTNTAVYHAHIGVTAQQLEMFGEALITGLQQIFGDEFNERTKRIVSKAYAKVCDRFTFHTERCQMALRTLGEPEGNVEDKKQSYKLLQEYFAVDDDGHDGQTGHPCPDGYSSTEGRIKSDCNGVLYMSNYGAKHPPPGIDDQHVREVFKKRWLDLRGRYLYYFKKPSDKPLGMIDLGMCNIHDTSITKTLPSPSPFSFAVVDASEIPVYFLCSGDTDKENWIGKLTKAWSRFTSSSPPSSRGHINRVILGEEFKPVAFSEEDFEVLCVLGKGSFGIVNKVKERASGNIYALKVLSKMQIINQQQVNEVKNECKILLELSHPFIVKLHATFTTKPSLCLLFQFLSGGDLFFHLRMSPGNHFDEARAKYYLAEVALALDHLQKNDIVHRDLKAENIVLDAEGHIVVTDFGFASYIPPDTRLTAACGTLAYMAPEVLCQQGYGFEVDWWAAGILMYLMLTGCYPFLRKDPRQTAENICKAPVVLPAIPKITGGAVDLINCLLQKNTEHRLSSLNEAKDHPFYENMDWESLYNRSLPVPFKPEPTGKNTKYFAEPKMESSSPPAVPSEDPFHDFFAIHIDYR
eukprot:Sspe_Gene.86910::Locus_57723_Transcript_1_1_Confidence_1.000_Length_2568::g.86910::m.86910/K04373/RPS6KA; ribosomal protein S6 kinase alpha-1/2/3/6